MTLVLLAIGWLATLATVALWGMPPWMAPALMLCAAPLALYLRGRTWAATLVAMAALSLAGGLRFSAWEYRDPPRLAAYVGQELTIKGVVASEPEPSETTTGFVIRAVRIDTAGTSVAVDGKVRVSTPQYADYLPGTDITLSGTLEDPPVFPDFDYRSYLARQDIVGTMYLPAIEVTAPPSRWNVTKGITQARLALDKSLQRSLPEPEASLAGGIAFGRDGNLPDDLYSDFRDAGLAHIVAVSGSNVSVVAALTFALSTWLIGRRAAIVPAALTVAGYLLIAGLSASVTRAGVMAMVFLFGSFLGRPRSALSALGAAVIVMTAYQPPAALDIGFQLSLAATAGLIVFGPWLTLLLTAGARRLRAQWIPRLAIDVASLSTSASLATLPLVWINFGRISVIGPLANIVIEPLFVLSFWLSVVTAVAGVVWQPAGWAIGLAAYYPLSLTTWFARTAAAIPFAAIDVPGAGGNVAFVAYAALAAAGWFAYRRYAPEALLSPSIAMRDFRRPVLAAAGTGLLACAVIPISLLPLGGPGEVVVDVLNLTNGHAIIVTTPSGQHVLIDGGSSGNDLSQQLGALLPHWDRNLALLIALGAEPQQVGAWPALASRYGVGRVIAADSQESEPTTVDGVTVERLLTPAGGTAAIRVTYRHLSVLIAGDLPAASERDLAAGEKVPATVLVLTGGGANQADSDLVRAVAPAVVAIPVSGGPFARIPSGAIIQAADGRPVLRTDTDGRIELRLNGDRVHYQTER